MDSASDLWIWVAAALLWWRLSAVVMGAPAELLASAARDPRDAALAAALARRSAARAAAAWRAGGALSVGLGGFALAFAGAYALTARSALAAAAFALLAPALSYGALGAREALRLERDRPGDAALLVRLRRLRARASAAAFASLTLVALARVATRAGLLW